MCWFARGDVRAAAAGRNALRRRTAATHPSCSVGVPGHSGALFSRPSARTRLFTLQPYSSRFANGESRFGPEAQARGRLRLRQLCTRHRVHCLDDRDIRPSLPTAQLLLPPPLAPPQLAAMPPTRHPSFTPPLPTAQLPSLQTADSYSTPGFSEFYDAMVAALPPQFEAGTDVERVLWPLLAELAAAEHAAPTRGTCPEGGATACRCHGTTTVLDLCTGSGRVALALAHHWQRWQQRPSAARLCILGVDSSREMLAAARAKAAAAAAGAAQTAGGGAEAAAAGAAVSLAWHCADMAALEAAPALAALPGSCSLAVVSAGSFHHLATRADQEACLRGLAAFLRRPPALGYAVIISSMLTTSRCHPATPRWQAPSATRACSSSASAPPTAAPCGGSASDSSATSAAQRRRRQMARSCNGCGKRNGLCKRWHRLSSPRLQRLAA